MTIGKENLGLAAEFAVASELCRRNIYAQLTMGRHKRTDILIEGESRMLSIQVKGKQVGEWPGIKGIFGESILIFVDYQGKTETERPDFYILTVEDWKALLDREWVIDGDHPIDSQNKPSWTGGTGDGYQGLKVKPKMIAQYKEQWDKLVDALSSK
ncbi:MAG: hypothetical protein ACYDHZ_01080 [Dehalococcoidia bacterium]